MQSPLEVALRVTACPTFAEIWPQEALPKVQGVYSGVGVGVGGPEVGVGVGPVGVGVGVEVGVGVWVIEA